MIPAPTAIGMFTCEQVIVDHVSRNPSLVNVFTGIGVEEFPSEPKQFSVFASLIDTVGNSTMRLVVTNLETDQEAYSNTHSVGFVHRRTILNLNLRLRGIRFPDAGEYEFSLFVDVDLIAQRTIRVYRLQES